MFYKKTGLPEESEFVICTVTSIQYHSVFVRLDLYDKTGMVHISEISPGRIRNLADYVEVGKKIVCKVIRIDTVKGHIDLSLRRVNEGQRREISNLMKKEQKAEKIVEMLARETKQKSLQVYEKIAPVALKEYEYVHQCFEDIVAGKYEISKFNLPKEIETSFKKLIDEKMQPPTYEIRGKIRFKTYASNGVEIIKSAFKKIENEKIKVSYLGGGAYNFFITSKDVEEANKFRSNINKIIEEFKLKGGEASFEEIKN